MNTAFHIGSVVFRSFLLLVVGVLFFGKSLSRVGFDYIPTDFYIAVSVPVVFFILLTLYYNLNAKHTRALRILQIVCLLLLAAMMVLVVYYLYDLYLDPLYDTALFIWGPGFIFFLSTLFTLFDVLKYRRNK